MEEYYLSKLVKAIFNLYPEIRNHPNCKEFPGKRVMSAGEKGRDTSLRRNEDNTDVLQDFGSSNATGGHSLMK